MHGLREQEYASQRRGCLVSLTFLHSHPFFPFSLSPPPGLAYAYTRCPEKQRARVGITHAYFPRDTASLGVEIFTDVQRPLTLARRAANPHLHPCSQPLFPLLPSFALSRRRGENFLRTWLKPFPSPSLIPFVFRLAGRPSILRDRRFVSVWKPSFFFLSLFYENETPYDNAEWDERGDYPFYKLLRQRLDKRIVLSDL